LRGNIQEKIKKVVNLWRDQSIFDEEIISEIESTYFGTAGSGSEGNNLPFLKFLFQILYEYR